MHSVHQNSREMFIQLKSKKGNLHVPHKLFLQRYLCIMYSAKAKGLRMLRGAMKNGRFLFSGELSKESLLVGGLSSI